jgi:environmental stress-induced protein Ves
MSPIPGLIWLDPATFRRTPWKNGGGITIDIADEYRPGADPGGWDGMVWRFGRTRIEVPAPFSDLSGLDRILMVVGGRGLLLRRAQGGVVDAREPFQPVRFPGEWDIRSELQHGPVEVLNLMADRSAVAIDLRVVEAGSPLEVEPTELVLYAPSGVARLRVNGHILDLPPGGAARGRTKAAIRLELEAGRVAVALIAARKT